MTESLDKKLTAVVGALNGDGTIAGAGKATVKYQKLVEGISTVMMGAMMMLDSVEICDGADSPSAAEVSASSAGVPIASAPPARIAENRAVHPDASGAAQETAEAEGGLGDRRDMKTASAARGGHQATSEADAAALAVIHDELITLITMKIKEDRANQSRIKTLLDRFGVARVSDLPPEKCGELMALIAGLGSGSAVPVGAA